MNRCAMYVPGDAYVAGFTVFLTFIVTVLVNAVRAIGPSWCVGLVALVGFVALALLWTIHRDEREELTP